MRNWLNKPIYGYGVWPNKEKEVLIDDKIFVLCPLTKENQASIHIDLTTQRISSEDAIALINRFLSHLCWFCHQPYWQGDGFSGGVVKSVNFDREQRMLFEGMIIEFPDAFELYDDVLISRALAFYRQAQVAKHYSLPYACLSYYKILEIEKKKRGPKSLDVWINEQLPTLQNSDRHIFMVLEGMASKRDETLSKFFFTGIRGEVAHYIEESQYNLDNDPSEQLFRYAAQPLEDLATKYIKEILDVDDHLLSRSYSLNSRYAAEKQDKSS